MQIFSKSKSNYNTIDFRTTKTYLKKILILSKINSACNNIFRIYKFYQEKKNHKYFQYWKNISLTGKIADSIDKKISQKINKLYESKINTLNKELKSKQKNLEELKEAEKIIQSTNKQIEKEKDILIKNKKKLTQKIEQLEKDNDNLEKEKRNKNNVNINTYQNFFNSKKDDEKIKELEKRLKELEEEEVDRKNYMDEYSEDMGKIMGVFEQKAKEIMRLQNNRRIDMDINNMNTNTGNSTLPNTNIINDDDIFNKIMGNK